MMTIPESLQIWGASCTEKDRSLEENVWTSEKTGTLASEILLEREVRVSTLLNRSNFSQMHYSSVILYMEQQPQKVILELNRLLDETLEDIEQNGFINHQLLIRATNASSAMNMTLSELLQLRRAAKVCTLKAMEAKHEEYMSSFDYKKSRITDSESEEPSFSDSLYSKALAVSSPNTIIFQDDDEKVVPVSDRLEHQPSTVSKVELVAARLKHQPSTVSEVELVAARLETTTVSSYSTESHKSTGTRKEAMAPSNLAPKQPFRPFFGVYNLYSFNGYQASGKSFGRGTVWSKLERMRDKVSTSMRDKVKRRCRQFQHRLIHKGYDRRFRKLVGRLKFNTKYEVKRYKRRIKYNQIEMANRIRYSRYRMRRRRPKLNSFKRPGPWMRKARSRINRSDLMNKTKYMMRNKWQFL